jgi:hypothetical protein
MVGCPQSTVSHLMAGMAIILWWKSLYFLKGFHATGTLVQVGMMGLSLCLSLLSLLSSLCWAVSHLMAGMAIILWWKSLYFLKGFHATGTLVQVATHH